VIDLTSSLGQRIHVMGNSCAGKSTLAARLAGALDVPVVELDALNWEPDWYGLNEHEPGRLMAKFAEATRGDGWVVAGSYTAFSQKVFWDRVQTVIWIDLPMPLLLRRVVARSWRRWRHHELLWGTNYEKFWPQFMVWRKQESLIWWIVTQHKRKQQQMLTMQAAPEWSHIRFIRLVSVSEVEALVQLADPRPL